MINKIKSSKVLKLLIPVIICMIFSSLLEIFVFNYSTLTLTDKEKGITCINISDLELYDIKNKKGKLTIVGDNPYFRIKKPMFISYLNFKLNNKESDVYSYFIDNQVSVLDAKQHISKVNINDPISIHSNNNSASSTFYINVEGEEKNIQITDITVDNSFRLNYIRIGTITLVLLLVSYLIIFNNFVKNNLHISFLLISLTVSVLLCLLIPPYYGYDEREHFIKSYETASGEFRIEKPEPVNWTTNINDFFIYRDGPVTFHSYKERQYYANKLNNNDYSNNSIFHTCAEPYLSVAYVPSSIGIGIGKLLKLPILYTFYLGRIFSAIFYCLLGTLCINKAKIAKRLIFCILLLPVALLGCATYSADSMALICSMIAIVTFINMLASKENEVGYKHLGVFISSISIATMSKLAYGPLCLLLLCIPRNRFKDSNEKKVLAKKLISFLLIGLVCVITVKFSSSKPINQWGIPGVDYDKQIDFIKHNPIKYLLIVFKYILYNCTDYFFANSTTLAYLKPLPGIFALLLTVTIFIISFIDNESETIYIKIKDKLIMFLSIGLCLGMVITAIYTSFNPALTTNIVGVQGRYFIPLMLPFLLLFKNNKLTHTFKNENINLTLIWIFCTTLIVNVIQVLYSFSI